MPQAWLTERIKDDVNRTAKTYRIKKEALLNVLVRLALNDEAEVRRAILLIRSATLGGQTDLERKGW